MFFNRKRAKTSLILYDDMDGILVNIMLMCALMLTICISLFGTVPMADMMLWDYQSALIWDETYRSFVVQHLAHKSFNFTKEIGPNTVFDIRKVLESPGGPSVHTRRSTSDKWVKNVNCAFHMTKDTVDPWVMSTVSESSFSKSLSWCYVSSVNIFTTCLLVSFFHYIVLKMSSLGETGELKGEPEDKERAGRPRRERGVEQRTGGKSHKRAGQPRRDRGVEKGARGKSHERAGRRRRERGVAQRARGKATKEQGDNLKDGLLMDQLYLVSWYIYILGWVLVFAMLAGIYTTFWGVMDLGRARFPQLAMFQEQLFRHTVSASLCSGMGLGTAVCLQVYIYCMDVERKSRTWAERAGACRESACTLACSTCTLIGGGIRGAADACAECARGVAAIRPCGARATVVAPSG